MGAKLIGDYKAVLRALNKMKDEVPDEAASDVEKASWAVKDYLVNTIQRQTFVTRALTDDYSELKGHDAQLVVTGDYVDSIEVLAKKTDSKPVRKGRHIRSGTIKWFVGPMETKSKPIKGFRGGGTSYRQIARYLEFGTSKMEPIPHWTFAQQRAKLIMRKIARKWNTEKFPWVAAGKSFSRKK